MTPLLSAHRGGAGDDAGRENTLEALRDAAGTECEYVEVDVQRCRDGVHVVHHDAWVRDGRRRVPVTSLSFAEFAVGTGNHLVLDDALDVLRGRTKVHLDLKFASGPEAGDVAPAEAVLLVRHMVEVMGPDAVVVTGLDDRAVAAVRNWSRDRYPELLVGLAVSRDVGRSGLARLLTGRLGEVLPGRRLAACDANLAVCPRDQARLWGASWAERSGLPLLVWTVDHPDELRTWLADDRTWMVTTNFPQRAIEIRRELAAQGR